MRSFFYTLLFISGMTFAQKGDFHLEKYLCKDGVERPFVVYSSEKEMVDSKKTLLVFLHGSVSSPELKKDPIEYAKKSQLLKLADEGNFYLLFCFGQKNATWFDSVGSDMVIGEIRKSIEKYKIDENKIFLSGFSDGGSGALYFSMTQPELFAGFIAMNGSLRVAEKLGKWDMFPENSNEKPMYIINTKEDMLYPIRQITPTIEYIKKFNPNIIYRELEGNHQMGYLETETPLLLDFIQKNSRKSLHKISWEVSDLENNNIEWLEVLSIDTIPQKSVWHHPYSLEVVNDKADFGVNYDTNYTNGPKIASFKKESTAEKMGAKVGDIILKMEEVEMKSPFSAFTYLAKKMAGQPTELTVDRDGETLVLKGIFNEGKPYQVFEHKKSGKVDAFIQGKVLVINTSKVSEIKISDKKLPNKIRKFDINGVKTKSIFNKPIIVKNIQ